MPLKYLLFIESQRASGDRGDERRSYAHLASPSSSPAQSHTCRGAHTLSSVFNANAAANRLPVELIIQILISGAWTEWHELVPLTHICQHWRNVARGTPRLWADAVFSVFKSGDDRIRCLPTLLERSAPQRLRLEIHSVLRVGQSAILGPYFDILGPHFSQISYLSVDIVCTGNFVVVLDAARSGMRNLESLRIKQVRGSQVSIDDRVALDDSDLPLLHTLFLLGFFFTRTVTVKTLKSLTIDGAPRSHHIFLAALDRCALSLEPLTIEGWAHPAWVLDGTDSGFRTIRLSSLRKMNITVSFESDPLRSLSPDSWSLPTSRSTSTGLTFITEARTNSYQGTSLASTHLPSLTLYVSTSLVPSTRSS